MLRLVVGMIVAAISFVTPARAQSEPSAGAAAARVIIEALAPSSYGDWAYRWDAVSIRVSRYMHWHLYGPEPRDRAEEEVRRNGWVDVEGQDVGVSAFGGDTHVTSLSLDLPLAVAPRDVLDAIRAAGAEVSFQADFETYSEYWIAPPGRDGATLSSHRICTSPRSAVAPRCHDELMLTFEQR